MDKSRRHELKMLHFKRRMKKMRPLSLKAGGDYYAYRYHSTPCSCWCCRSLKYNRAKEKRGARKLAEPISEVVITPRSIVKQTPFVPAIEGCEEEEAAMEIIREDYFEF